MFENFLSVCKDVTKTTRKIPQGEYLSDGTYKIFDQGKNYIGGYCNTANGVASDYPYIVFGDHTRVIKYINEPCYIGADGVKLLKVYNNDFIPKFVYYAMLANPVEHQGYSRHFKLLKETKIRKYDKSIQNTIIDELDKINLAISLKESILNHLDELVKSRFIEMLGDPQNNNKQFPTKKLIDVVTLQRGHDLPVQNRDSHGSVPVYGSNGVLGFHTIAKCDRGIITGRSGTIGEVYVSEEPFWPLNTTLYSNNTHGNNLIYLKYLLMFFNLKRFKSGAGVPTLNRNEFHGKEIMDVPIELQNEFADFVKLIDKSKFIVQKQIDDLQELLDSKMDEYFG